MPFKLFAMATLCGLASCAELESPAPEPTTDPGAVTDATNPAAVPQGGKSTGTSNLVGTGPIAYGAILADGTKYSGTSNWTSAYNATYQRYEITITGESYFYLSYATVVTPAGDVRTCNTNSVSGKLLISCFDLAGNPATSRIGFVTSKP